MSFLRRLLGLCAHRDTYRETRGDVRVLICDRCHTVVRESPRMPDCGPAHESMKAKPVKPIATFRRRA